MLPVALLYALMIIDIAGHFVPVLVGAAALGRARRSAGFNRWVYLYVSAFSGATLVLLAIAGWSVLTQHILALAAAWATLPLWLCVRVALPPTRSRLPARAAPAGPDPAPGETPIPFFTTWRLAARALQG